MRALRNFAIFLVAVLAVGVVLDVGVCLLLQNRVESEIENADRQVDVGNVETEIGSFPFLPGLAVKGEVNHLSLRLEDLVTPGVTFKVLQVAVEGLTFDRTVLFNAQVQVQRIDRAAIRAEITDEAASEAVGVPVTFTPDAASVLVAGQPRAATVTVVGSDLVLSAEGVGQLTIPLSASEYIPCPPGVKLREGLVVLRCTADELPPAVRPFLGGGVG